MAKVIEFYLRGPVLKEVKPVPIEQRGKIVEFPQGTIRPRSLKQRTLRNAVKQARQPSFSLDVFKDINEQSYGNGICGRKTALALDAAWTQSAAGPVLATMGGFRIMEPPSFRSGSEM